MTNRSIQLKILIILSLLCVSAYSKPMDKFPQLQFQKANETYAQGNYEEARDRYEEIVDGGIVTPELYFNLGNTYAQLEEKGKAVLMYEKAWSLAPRDPDINYNLRFLAPKDNFQDVFFLLRPLWFVRHKLTISELFRINCVFYVLFFMLLVSFFMVKSLSLRRTIRSLFLINLLFCLFFGYNLAMAITDKTSRKSGILLESTIARSGPGDSFVSVLELPEGLKVITHDEEKAGWLKIQLLNGQTGYIPPDKVGII